jgi:hypothetical protein
MRIIVSKAGEPEKSSGLRSVRGPSVVRRLRTRAQAAIATETRPPRARDEPDHDPFTCS